MSPIHLPCIMGPPEFHVDGASYKGSSKERWVHVSPLLMQMFHCPIGPHLQIQIQKHSDSEFQDSDSRALNQAQGSPECMGIHAQTHTNTQVRTAGAVWHTSDMPAKPAQVTGSHDLSHLHFPSPHLYLQWVFSPGARAPSTPHVPVWASEHPFLQQTFIEHSCYVSDTVLGAGDAAGYTVPALMELTL